MLCFLLSQDSYCRHDGDVAGLGVSNGLLEERFALGRDDGLGCPADCCTEHFIASEVLSMAERQLC